MTFADEIALAWDLLDALPELTGPQRTTICVEIGAGDLPGAIEHLLSALISRGRALSPDMAARVSLWLNSYAGCADHASLHQLVHENIHTDST